MVVKFQLPWSTHIGYRAFQSFRHFPLGAVRGAAACALSASCPKLCDFKLSDQGFAATCKGEENGGRG